MTQWGSVQLTQTPKAPKAVPGCPGTSLEGPQNVPWGPLEGHSGDPGGPRGIPGPVCESPWEVLGNNLGSLGIRQVLPTGFRKRIEAFRAAIEIIEKPFMFHLFSSSGESRSISGGLWSSLNFRSSPEPASVTSPSRQGSLP